MAREGTDRRPLILVADDEETVRIVLAGCLINEGFDVDEAEDGARVVERFACRRPALIVLDVMMPELNGYDACAAIRARPDGAEVPVLVVTGLDDHESIWRAHEAGVTGFINSLHHVKRSGGNGFLYYSSNMLNLSRQRPRLAAHLNRALEREEWSPVINSTIYVPRAATAYRGF